MHRRKLLLGLDDLSEVLSFWIVTCGTTAMQNRETKRLFQIDPTTCRSMWRRLPFPTASTNSWHWLFWMLNLGKPRISTELAVTTNPSTLSKNDDILTAKLYPIPHFFVFHILLWCVFGIFRRVEFWVDQSLDTIAPWPCQAVVDTFVRLGFPGSRRVRRKIHSLEKSLLESTTWCYFLLYSCCVIATADAATESWKWNLGQLEANTMDFQNCLKTI